MAKAKMWKDGKEFYGKGIALLTQKGPEQGDNESSTDMHDVTQEDAQKMKEIEEACYINHALCNLELSTEALTCPDILNADWELRELPLLHTRLRGDSSPESSKCQSLLPLCTSASSSR
jgi:hypothetical protein